MTRLTGFHGRSLERSAALPASCRQSTNVATGCRHRTESTSILRRCSMSMPSRRNLLAMRSEEHTSELQSRFELVCRLLLEKTKNQWQAYNLLSDLQDGI